MKVVERQVSIHELINSDKEDRLYSMFGASTHCPLLPINRVCYRDTTMMLDTPLNDNPAGRVLRPDAAPRRGGDGGRHHGHQVRQRRRRDHDRELAADLLRRALHGEAATRRYAQVNKSSTFYNLFRSQNLWVSSRNPWRVFLTIHP